MFNATTEGRFHALAEPDEGIEIDDEWNAECKCNGISELENRETRQFSNHESRLLLRSHTFLYSPSQYGHIGVSTDL